MLKLLVAALSVFAIQAHANDGSIAVVDVLGIAPNAPNTSWIAAYGGNTKRLYDVLPVTAIPEIKWKSLFFASPSYAVTINCHEEYQRPTTGETRYDYMCSFHIDSRENSGVDWEENNPWYASPDDFFSYVGSSSITALGVYPGPVKNGKFFSFYGGNAQYFAERIPSALTFSSPKYRLKLACQKDYQRPTTGEWRSDYMCTVSVQPR
jgi:hypothetical protein